jgi:ankyrin repeat protein
MLVEQLYFSKIDERLTNLTPAQGNTCRWLLSKSEYTDWYNNVKLHDHCGFLWIKGNPGTGKSTLMKFLFENERSNRKNDHLQILLSFFFLARGTPEEKSTVGLYRSLLHQLFQKVPSLTESLNWMTPDGARVIQRGGWSEEALKQTLKHAAEKLGNTSLTMYIDALDECEDSQAERMIRFFEELCEESVGKIRICFSSRHYPHIEITTGAELTLEDEDGHKEDIQKYIKSNLKLGRRNQQTESLQLEILEKSSRIFLWVVLVIKILTDLPDKSIRKMRERLQEIPTKLTKLFKMILARDRKNLEQMKHCLSWVLFAIRPLKPQELYFAIQLGLDKACSAYWDTDDIDIDSMKTFVKSSSKGLIEVTRNKAGEVQFIHESVREFLLSEDGARWSGASGNLVGHGHRHLRDCCLAQINATITQHVDIPESLPKPAETDKLRKTIASKFPFLQYAVLSILQHANSAQHAGLDQRAFLSDFPLPRWIFLNNAFEKFEVRRYTQTVTLLYILAERNLADLIHIYPHLESWLDVHDDRYGPPIFAARATGSHEAAKAILQAQIHERPAGSSVRRLLERCLENTDNNPTFGRDFTFSRTKGVTQHVIEQGDEVVLNFLYSLGKVDPAWKERKDRHLRMPLAWAAKNGQDGVVRFLLEKGAEVDWKDRDRRTALCEGTLGGHEAVVKLLLKNGAEVDSKDINGKTPLSHAAYEGDQAVVKLLLENGAEVESKDNNGRTPLSWAASSQNKAVVELLLKNGAEVDSKDNNGQTPLSWAARRANEDVVELLLENGAEVELKDNNGRTLLSLAASRNFNSGVTKLLLSNPRVDPEAKDKDGRSPLSWAASDGDAAVTKLLLSDHRVNPEAKDNNGRTPLSWAASSNFLSAVIKLLLSDHRVNPEARDKDGRTPLSWAASRNFNSDMVKLLLSDPRVDPEARDKDGRTPLSWAASDGNEAEIKLLLSDPRVDPEAKDNDGRTPLSWAASERYGISVIELLLSDPRVNPEAKDNDGRTPLSWAASKGFHTSVPRLLLSDPRVDPEAKDNNGRTPLSWAASDGYEAVIKLLLSDPRVDPDAKDKDGRTPSSWAREKGYDNVARLLEGQRSSLGLRVTTL